MFILKFSVFWNLFLVIHQWEVVQHGGLLLMLLPKSICLCIPFFKVCCLKALYAQSTILVFFWPDMNTKIDVVIYMYL